jgi:hypothetical protein
MPESVFLHPENIAYLNENPNLSYLFYNVVHISLVKHFYNKDLVPAGNKGNPTISSGILS